VDFKVPKIECEEAEEIPYTDCVDAEKVQMTSKMTCEVKHATSCKPTTSTKCQSITYQECAEVPQELCEEVQMKVPEQEKDHRKKCLLPDDGEAGANITPRGSKALGLGRLDAVVAAAKASIFDEHVEESRRAFANPLPLAKRPQQVNRQGRVFQSQQAQTRFVQQQQQQQQQQQFRRFPGQEQGQFVRGN
jgi:hypothetical protein